MIGATVNLFKMQHEIFNELFRQLLFQADLAKIKNQQKKSLILRPFFVYIDDFKT